MKKLLVILLLGVSFHAQSQNFTKKVKINNLMIGQEFLNDGIVPKDKQYTIPNVDMGGTPCALVIDRKGGHITKLMLRSCKETLKEHDPLFLHYKKMLNLDSKVYTKKINEKTTFGLKQGVVFQGVDETISLVYDINKGLSYLLLIVKPDTISL